MGSGCCKIPQIPTYINESNPPCVSLCLIETKNDKPLKNDTIQFDHYNLMKLCNAFHIEYLSIYFSDYIIGLEIQYLIDGKLHTVKNLGTEPYINQGHVFFEIDEHIDIITAYHDDRGLTSLYFHTTKERVIFFEGGIKGPDKQEINLKDNNRGVICFKGELKEVIKDLSVYHLQIIKLDEDGEDEKEKEKENSTTTNSTTKIEVNNVNSSIKLKKKNSRSNIQIKNDIVIENEF